MRFALNRMKLLAVILCCTAAASLLLKPESGGDAFSIISVLPLVIGDWEGREMPVDETTKRILETDAVMMRSYSKQGAGSIVLAIVYYRGDHVALHLPESCVMGKGSRLTQRSSEAVASRAGNIACVRLVTSGTPGKYVILYYFQTGKVCTGSYLRFRKTMVMNRLFGRTPGGALVRVSRPCTGNGEQDTNILKNFLSVFAPELALLMERTERQE